jgi:hypothetical protein
VKAGKSYRRGRLSTVDLLVQTNLDQILYLFLKYLSVTKSYPNEEVNCTEPSPSVGLPWWVNTVEVSIDG